MNEACTIVIRGATQQILDEAERSLHDALCVLTQTVKEPRTVYGGGKTMMFINDDDDDGRGGDDIACRCAGFN